MSVTKKKGTDVNLQQQIVTVVSKAANIESSDIASWRTAVNAAKQGNRRQLYKLYENLMADGVFSRAVDKRIEAITNAELLFTDANGQPVDAVNAVIDTPEFERLLREIMLAKAWGVSVIDILSAIPFDCFSVPRRNINTAKKLILPDELSDTGLDYSTVPYIFEVNADDPFGFIYKVAPYVIYKRGGYGDWAQFVELFGMPFRIGKYNAYDVTTRDEIIKSLQAFGAAPWAVVPKEAEFEFMQNNASGNGDLYDKFLARCDKEILITVLGQTMTTIDGSSKSQSETHKEVEEDINKSDRKFIRRILNANVLPILEASGLPVKGGKFVFPEQGESLTTEQRVNIALSIKNNGVPVADEYLYEISGVSKPEDGQTVSRLSPPPPVPGTSDPAKPDPANTDDKKKLSAAWDGLISFFAEALGQRATLKF